MKIHQNKTSKKKGKIMKDTTMQFVYIPFIHLFKTTDFLTKWDQFWAIYYKCFPWIGHFG